MSNELGYCEIYKPCSHGILNPLEYNIAKIYTSLLYQYDLSVKDFFDINSYDRKEWETTIESQHWRDYDTLCHNPFVRSPTAIRLNCLHIVKKIKYKDYTFCIIKTFWLKIFQRKWKKLYKKMLHHRKNTRNIISRQVSGKWH